MPRRAGKREIRPEDIGLPADTEPIAPKYHNRKTERDGELFDSVWEADYYLVLLERQQNGEIEALKRQVTFEVLPALRDAWGTRHRPVRYVADFVYYDRAKGCTVVVDTKGMKTREYRLKRKLFAHRYPRVRFEEVSR